MTHQQQVDHTSSADWQGIANAPYGQEVEVRVERMTFPAILFLGASMSSDGTPCDQWQAAVEGQHPPCWSGGSCWASNEDEVASLQPTAWRHLPPVLDQAA